MVAVHPPAEATLEAVPVVAVAIRSEIIKHLIAVAEARLIIFEILHHQVLVMEGMAVAVITDSWVEKITDY